MLHNVLIGLHAVSGVVSFAAGAFSLGLSTARSWPFRIYFGSLGALVLFLAVVVSVDWSGLEPTAQLVYVGLFALGLYMVWRAAQARTRLRSRGPDWRHKYVGD